MWCDAIEFEAALVRDPHPDPKELMRQARAYPSFIVPVRTADGSLYMTADETGAGVVHLFTAPGNLYTFLELFAPAMQELLRPVTIAGGTILDLLAGSDDIVKVIVNVAGPGPTRIFPFDGRMPIP